MSRSLPSRAARPATRSMTRRTALGSFAGTVLVAAGLAGCGTTEASPRAPVQPDADSDADPDTVLLRSVVGEVDGVVALLEVVRRRERSLRPRVDRLLAVHRTHRELLAAASGTDETPEARPTRRIPRGKAASSAEVTRREQHLATRLADAAVEAESGSFARVLASMSAGLRQHLEVG